MIAAPVMNHAMNAEVYGIGRTLGMLLFLGGGTLAVVAGAWVSAELRGRHPRADAAIAGGAYLLAAILFLALIFGQPAESQLEFPQVALYTSGCLALFGSLFGVGVDRHYKKRRVVLLAVGFSAIALLASVLIFILAYLFAGGNLLVVYGIVSMKWKVPVGLVLSGFLGALLPGVLAEFLLGASRRNT
jgi:hypothetical protein